MGTIRKVALGGFSGEAGSMIGSSWRDINYINGLPKLSNKPKTEKQAKFALAVRFLLPVKSMINIGFGQAKTGTAFLEMFNWNKLRYTGFSLIKVIVTFDSNPNCE